jgi:carbon-monoxide dehydrogenase medium subunit
VILRPFQYVECADVGEAVAALSAHGDDARLIAGGTALVPLMKHQVLRPAVLVSVARVPALSAIQSLADGGLRIGALATHAAVARSPLVRERAPLLAEACGRVASPTIRAMGTLGGNLCYGESASDPSPALLALRAELRLAGPDAERVVPITEFFTGFYETALGDGEVLTAIDVPPVRAAADTPSSLRWRYLKWTPRAREDKALVGLAVMLSVADGVCRAARLGLGGVAVSPVALAGAERALDGARLEAATLARVAEIAAAEVEPIDDLQATAGYRRDMLRVWTRRVLAELA